jgi:hypothetical protein
MKMKKWGEKTITGPGTRSCKHSNGKRRALKVVETRERREGKKACQAA